MKIGILITGHPVESLKHMGDYGEHFKRLLDKSGFEFQSYLVVDGFFPKSPENNDGYVITGSRHGTYENHDFIPPLEDFIRDCFAQDVPMAGFCFGHQIMAQALGGKVEKYEGGWSAGNETYDLNGKDVAMMAWHQDQVVEAPSGAETIARSDFCKYAGLSYGKTGFSLQGHPEFQADFMQGLLDEKGDMLGKNIKANAQKSLNEPISTDEIADIIIAFFKENERTKNSDKGESYE